MTVSVRLAVLLLVPSLGAAAPATLPPEPGEQWENTVEMQMAGFSMPAQTSKSCVPKKGMTDPPGTGGDDDKCKVTRMQNDGKTMSWSMVCEGKEKMSGDGEITQTANGYEGKMTMRSAGGDMLMKMRGKKLGVACDASEMKRKMAAVKAEVDASIASSCRDMATSMMLHGFTGPKAMCKDPADRALLCERAAGAKNMMLEAFAGPQAVCKAPADRALLCERAATREGVRTLRSRPEAMRKDLASVCGKDFAAMKAQVCAAAGKEEAATNGDEAASGVLEFIGSTCPAETRVLAQRECAGRYYTDSDTNLSKRYLSFCTSYAADLLDTEKKPAAKAKKPKDPAQDSTQDAAKKAVKSLLPF